jgi:hypothetical protein
MRVATFFLGALTALLLAAPSSQPAQAEETAARLTAEDVTEIADAFAKSKVEDLDRYSAQSPKYDPASRTWTVFYHQTKAPYAPDRDFWVHINDASGNACLDYGLVPSCA